MVTPMMVQYLVGLCCFRHEPQAVEIIVGDTVFDEIAERERDVDVTVTIADENGVVTAFKAAEVKHEGRPLDVAKVEQLIAKLTDMPKVTHRAIFSTSGYTDTACLKARKRGVDLYTLQRWDRPIDRDFPDFSGIGIPDEYLRFRSNLLFWNEFQCAYSSSETGEFSIFHSATRVLNENGGSHSRWPVFGDYHQELLVRSTGILCTQEPAQVVFNEFVQKLDTTETETQFSPSWLSTHRMDLSQDGVYLKRPGGSLSMIDAVTISGFLQWRSQIVSLDFMILNNVLTDSVFSGAAIADIGAGDGRMFAMTFPEKGHQIGIHRFQIPKEQRNMIRKLSIGDHSYDGSYRVSKR
ncbi:MULTISPECIES: hypothetical protein [Burkholderia]|uniref:Restriction endonuclease type IV Mrr domain-containing protein n=1 Tax=Burkholderia paludis TaxID=1506587 RepID=A0A6P2SQL9_9BURK|nr:MULTISPECIES: hypothetical protein [Burkholderia]CAB3773917.1 hypothetical protein LMG30113_07362 [Burkholderia paludis]VWC47392.1 hypothetical protein BPA30113_07425 [Burkholderia paludis]